MEKMFCANENCIKHKEHAGGKFKLVGGQWLCQDCAEWAGTGVVFNKGKNLFQFSTTHFNGRRIDVKGLGHLRKLEKEFGVSSVVANNMERNFDRHG